MKPEHSCHAFVMHSINTRVAELPSSYIYHTCPAVNDQFSDSSTAEVYTYCRPIPDPVSHCGVRIVQFWDVPELYSPGTGLPELF